MFEPSMQKLGSSSPDSNGPMYSMGRDEDPNKIIPIYRGISTVSKPNGMFYSPDREWTRQFTQSGQDHEIKADGIRNSDVLRPSKPVYAGDFDAIDAVVKYARTAGYKAVELDEGRGEPPSIYVFNKTALGQKPK